MSTAIPVADTLNLLPEVTWDRWAGDGVGHVSVFGWIGRPDGKSDFVLVMIDQEGPWLINTSSAQYSAEFSARLGFPRHSNCKRVEDDFPGVRSVRLHDARVGCAACDRGDFQLGHADGCLKGLAESKPNVPCPRCGEPTPMHDVTGIICFSCDTFFDSGEPDPQPAIPE